MLRTIPNFTWIGRRTSLSPGKGSRSCWRCWSISTRGTSRSKPSRAFVTRARPEIRPPLRCLVLQRRRYVFSGGARHNIPSMPQVHTLKLPKLRAPKGATLFPLNADEDQRERMPRLGYVDLVLYHERGVGSAESLLKKHAHSLGYLEHLPAHYAPVAVHGADFNETVVRNKFRFVAVKGTN